MAVAIRCDECGRVYHLRADGEITQIECSCGAVLRVPIEGTPRVIAPAPPPPPAASPAVAAWRRGVRYRYYFMHSSGSDLEQLATMLDQGTLEAIVDRTFPFSRVADAFAYLEKGHAKGKVVVTMDAG